MRNIAVICAILMTSLVMAWIPAAHADSSRAATTAWDWTGFYAGVHAGGGWGATNWHSATGPLAAFATDRFAGSGNADGSLAGVQIGLNHQFGRWVAGAEVDASWSDLKGYAKCASRLAPTDSFVCGTQIDTLGTLTGRLGWTANRLLIYAKAGAAWAHIKHEAEFEGAPGVFRNSGLRWGYTFGAGAEYAFSPGWSGRFEYNFVDLGRHTATLTAPLAAPSTVMLGQHLHLFKIGLNRTIGPGPRMGAPGHAAGVLDSLSDWTLEAGTRVWFSDGKMQKDLYDNGFPSQLNSRLIYGGMSGHSIEAFARLDHRSGLFAKGTLGLGSLPNGKLRDEDYPPGIPYSNTAHGMGHGSLRNGSLDVGYNLIDGPDGRIGAFAGYRHFYQRGNGYGCTQTANGTICVPSLPETLLVLSETEHWRGLALGVNARLPLTQRLRLEVEAAYLPYVDRAGVDNHWLRADINPMPASGHGWGTQVEAILSYAVTQRLSLGLGARYWFFTTTQASTLFPGEATTSPLKYTADRYGGFLQASYRIGGPDRAEPDVDEAPPMEPPMDWSGPYVGVHFGAGFGRNDWSDPFPPPPSGDRVLTGGALGGVQIGVDHQIGQWVMGAEIAGSWGRIEGTETCFGGLPAAIAGVNCENRTDALATLTGRLGAAFGQSLIYARAGVAAARQTIALNTSALPGGGYASRRSHDWGWTVGGGIEHALTPQWSVNVEYRHVDLGAKPNGLSAPGVMAAASSETLRSRLHLVSVGLNRRFSLAAAQ